MDKLQKLITLTENLKYEVTRLEERLDYSTTKILIKTGHITTDILNHTPSKTNPYRYNPPTYELTEDNKFIVSFD
jgi:hypothetical protein